MEPWSAEAEAPREGVPKELECTSWRRFLVGDGEDIGPRDCDLAAAGEFPDWYGQIARVQRFMPACGVNQDALVKHRYPSGQPVINVVR